MLIRSFAIVAISMLSIPAFAYDEKTCQIKKQKIQEQLVYAKKHNNSYRVRGLERALANVDRKCTASRKSSKSN